MQKEIEVKAHITETEMKRLLLYFNSHYKNGKVEFKKDAYFREKDGSLFRLRICDGTYIYTKKKNSMMDGVEVNNENEKEITKDEYEKTYNTSSLYIEKSKEGYIWKTHDIYGFDMNIEIINVKGKRENQKIKNLGYFLEVEIIENDDSNDKRVNILKDELLTFLNELGVSKKIEDRKYIKMIGDDE